MDTLVDLAKQLEQLTKQLREVRLELREVREAYERKPRTPEENCRRKVRHASKRDANTAINSMKKDGRRLAHRLRCYHCPACNGYHLTKQEL
jgi:uncharacterized coiled-coil DUF342 family protein